MKKHLLIFILCGYAHAVFSQTQKVSATMDTVAEIISLQKQWTSAASDSTRQRLYEQQSEYFRNGHKSLANRVLKKAQEQADYRLQIQCLDIMANLFLIERNGAAALPLIEQKLALCKLYNKKEVTATVSKMGQAYETLNDYKKALEKYEEALKLAVAAKEELNIADLKGTIADLRTFFDGNIEKSIAIRKEITPIYLKFNKQVQLAMNYGNIAYCYVMVGKADSALVYGKKSRALANTPKTIRILSNTYLNFAYAYDIKGDWSNAIKYYDSTAIEARKYEDINKLGAALTGRSSAYVKLGNHTKALNNLDSAEYYYINSKQDNFLASVYANKADIYRNLKQHTKAKAYFEKALTIYKKIGDRPEETNTRLQLAGFDVLDKKYDKAHKAYANILQAYQALRDTAGIRGTEYEIARLYFIQGQYPIAQKLIEPSLAYSLAYGLKDPAAYRAKLAHQIDSAMGDFKSALNHYKIYAIYADSLRNKDNMSLVVEYTTKYDTQKLRADKAEAQNLVLQAQRDKQILWWGLGFVAMLAGVGFVGYVQQRKKKAIAEQLAQTQTTLAKQNEEIAAKEKEHGERLSELFAEIEYRNEKLDKAAFSQKQMMDEIATYFKNKEEEKALKYLKVIVNQTHTSKEEERKQQVATFREQHPQFLPNLLSKHEGFQGKYQHQDMAVLLAQGTTDMGEVAELFGCSKKRAQNIQSEVRALLQQPQENVGDYLRKLTSSALA